MTKLIVPPKSYLQPDKHLHNLLFHPWYKVLNAIHSNILNATNEFYKNECINPVLFPITTQSISSPMGIGSDSLPVKVNIKGNDIYLADSMQFCLEIGARLNDKGAYYIMPTFRGENVDERHLNEFIHSEVEIKGNLGDVMSLAERYIKFLIKNLLDNMSSQISRIVGTVEHLQVSLNKPFMQIRYEDALKELKNIKGAYIESDAGGKNLTSIGEKALINIFGDFVWITHLPWKLVPFYQSRENEISEYSNSADLLAGIGEILGAGQRVLTLKDLDDSLKIHANDVKSYEWYRQMREFMQVQTSGFGLGIERFILWVLNHNDIRDCSLLLRDHCQLTMP